MAAACFRFPRWLPRALVSKLARHEAGMAAVEFSLILPILVLLWLGGVEVTQGLSVDRRLNNLASAVGDLVARSKIVTYADVTNIFAISTGAMFPYPSTGVGMRVTAVDMDASGNGTVAWSRGSGATAYTNGTSMNALVPQTLRVANTQVIMSEVYFTYKPTVGYVITGTVPLNDRLFFVPRLVTNVQLCASNPPPTTCSS